MGALAATFVAAIVTYSCSDGKVDLGVTNYKHLMGTLLLLFLMLMPLFKFTDAQIGVCYGQIGDNLPSKRDVVNLYNANGIQRMRIYSPDQETLQALRGSNIELILDVPNDQLQSLASTPSAATTWVKNNIQAYQDVRFKYIAVGNEVDPKKPETSQYTQYVLPAMQNVHNAIVVAGLQNQIKVSTSTYTGLLANTYPPSQSSFDGKVRSFIEPIVRFLSQNNLPLLANIYPYFAYIGNTGDVQLSYALFTAPGVVVADGNLLYKNLFDALLDSHYAALEKAGASNVGIVVSESGWPSAGGTGASVENARTYYKNLIGHVSGGGGTPRRPSKAIEAYLFAMFDENQKQGDETERNFGLFTHSHQAKYQITFN